MRNSLIEVLVDSAGYKAVEGDTVRSIGTAFAQSWPTLLAF